MTGHGSSPDHSRYQRGIIRRSYEHKDTIALQRLGEIVSDLYLAEGAQKSKLWERAKLALVKLAPNDPLVQEVLAKKDLAKLARLVTKLSASVRATPPNAAQEVDGETEPEAAVRPAQEDVATPASPAASMPPAVQSDHVAGTEANDPPSPETLKRAMKSFRKRLKLKKLDDESRLGRSPMTSGKQSAVVAIMAPREFPAAVWEELARQGKLRHRGGSFYELTD